MLSGREGINFLSFAAIKRKKERNLPAAGRNHRCMKFSKNYRLSLNCGKSALHASNNPQFFTLPPQFS
jgi:hypothetical protein